jgi:hypothetical protein
MTKWHVSISQNGWEYTGWMSFFANEVTRINPNVLLVDGNEMQFDEEVKFQAQKELNDSVDLNMSY